MSGADELISAEGASDRPTIGSVPQMNTARGSIDTADLGVTLMHEHVFVLSPEITDNYPEVWGDEAKREADAIARLNELKSRGVDSIVDLTVIGLGRYIPRIARIAAETDINIVVATGVYTYNDVPMHFHFSGPGTLLDGPEPMVEMFVRDIEQGIAGTDVKAAILKCATDEPGVTPGVERVLRAVAQAHHRTGVPISTHTHAPTRRGLEQQRIFAEEGVDLTRVVIGHCGDTTDVDYLEEIIGNGSFIGMDRFGLYLMLPFEDRVNTVTQMCERGHADKMVLSHDASCFIDWLPEEVVPVGLPNWHYLHIHNDVIPALKERGVTDQQLTTMLVDNPRRVFEHRGAY
jgi:phosphotriesterase-related protein